MTLIIAGATEDADKAAFEFILSNMSKRLSDQLRTAARERATPDTESTETAMARVIKVVRELQADEAIELLPIPEPED